MSITRLYFLIYGYFWILNFWWTKSAIRSPGSWDRMTQLNLLWSTWLVIWLKSDNIMYRFEGEKSSLWLLPGRAWKKIKDQQQLRIVAANDTNHRLRTFCRLPFTVYRLPFTVRCPIFRFSFPSTPIFARRLFKQALSGRCPCASRALWLILTDLARNAAARLKLFDWLAHELALGRLWKSLKHIKITVKRPHGNSHPADNLS